MSSYPSKGPKVRGECYQMPRPCPFFTCKWHFSSMRPAEYWKNCSDNEIIEDMMTVNFSCALDAADRGDMTLEEIGEMMATTRERVRQIEGLSSKPFQQYNTKPKGVSMLRHPSRHSVVRELMVFLEGSA